MKDGALRRAVKAVARGAFYVDVRIDRARRRLLGRHSYALGGACGRCAACCEAPTIQVHPLVFLSPRLRRVFLWWQRQVNGFELVEARRAERSFVFRCTHFDRATRACDSYASRPGMCRDYPRALLFQPSPELLPGCGYRPLARNAARLARALELQPMSEEQRARLRRELHLE